MEFKKISLYSVPALKSETDEHLGDVFESVGYTESNTYLDTKLILGYASVGLAGLMYHFEKQFKNDFHNKTYVLYLQCLVFGYFALQTINYLFMKIVEKDIKYVGYKKGKKLVVSTSTKSKTDNSYNMVLQIDGDDQKLSFPFNEVFFDDGYLSLDALKEKIMPIVSQFDKSK